MKKAIICGISGQDAAYLCDFLLKKKYKVIGVTRRVGKKNYYNLNKIGIKSSRIKIVKTNFKQFTEVNRLLLKFKPDELYYLNGQSLVDLSFKKPSTILIEDVTSVLNLLESIKTNNLKTRVFFANSGQIFGNTINKKINENSKLNPLSPYAVSKTIQYHIVKQYRELYSIYASNGILFNHESPLRRTEFVTQKIISFVKLKKNKLIHQNKKLHLSNINVFRDWGWAAEYVEGMWRILQHKRPDDFIISTGQENSLKAFIEYAFKKEKMNWKEHVKIKNQYFHKIDLIHNSAKPKKIYKLLKWKPKSSMKIVINKMLKNNLF